MAESMGIGLISEEHWDGPHAQRVPPPHDPRNLYSQVPLNEAFDAWVKIENDPFIEQRPLT